MNHSVRNNISQGVPSEDILKMMGAVTLDEDVIWQNGKVSGAIYHGEKNHLELLNKAFSLYSIANPLHPDIWPSGMKYESEIIAMTAALVGLDDERTANVCGCTTSVGFTECCMTCSILPFAAHLLRIVQLICLIYCCRLCWKKVIVLCYQ